MAKVAQFLMATDNELRATLSEASRPITTLLITLMKGRNAKCRLFALQLLEDLGSNANDAVPVLHQRLTRVQDSAERQATASALSGIGTEDAVTALISTFETSSDSSIRVACAHALGAAGKPAERAIPLLAEAGADDDPGVRAAANNARRQIHDAVHPPTLTLDGKEVKITGIQIFGK